MGRDRSRDRRERSPDRSRKRSRSRSRERGRWEDPDPTVAQMQALAAMEAQAQLQRQMMAQQGGINSMLNAGMAIPGLTVAAAPANTIAQTIGGASSTAARKAREIYIGNLCIGTVNKDMLQEFFNAALAGLVPDPINQPPVIEVKMDATAGRYAFVELRTEELATTAMTLDKTELCGRQMNIGRPKGYVPGSGVPVPVASHDKLGLAQQLAAQLAGGVTNVVLLEGMLAAGLMRDDEEKREVLEMVYEECVRCGKVLGIAVPLPPEGGDADEQPCRAYIKFNVSGEATKCKEMMDGRLFDESKVKATYATEVDYNRAAAGEWIVEGEAPAAAAAGPVAVPIGAPSGVPSAPLSVPAMAGSLPGLGMGLPSFMPGLIPGLSFPPPP